MRYNPETGERVLVSKTAWQYGEWSNRRPSARSIEEAAGTGAAIQPPEPGLRGAARRVLEEAGKSATTATTQAIAARTRTYGPRVAEWVAANAGKIARYSLVGLAGVAAYALTSKLMTVRHKTYSDLLYDLANEYRWARQRAAEGAGRPLTADELASFTRWYKQKAAAIVAARDAGRSITGITSFVFGD